MNGPLGDDLDNAMAKLKEIRAAADGAGRMMADTSYTLMSKRKLLSVTVAANGEVTALTFNGEGYRSLAPAELSKMIIETTNEARKLCMAEASKALQEIWPDGGRDFDLMSAADNIDNMMSRFLKVTGVGLTDDEIRNLEDSWKAGL
jgi:DNA-binding protein YbaB